MIGDCCVKSPPSHFIYQLRHVQKVAAASVVVLYHCSFPGRAEMKRQGTAAFWRTPHLLNSVLRISESLKILCVGRATTLVVGVEENRQGRRKQYLFREPMIRVPLANLVVGVFPFPPSPPELSGGAFFFWEILAFQCEVAGMNAWIGQRHFFSWKCTSD